MKGIQLKHIPLPLFVIGLILLIAPSGGADTESSRLALRPQRYDAHNSPPEAKEYHRQIRARYSVEEARLYHRESRPPRSYKRTSAKQGRRYSSQTPSRPISIRYRNSQSSQAGPIIRSRISGRPGRSAYGVASWYGRKFHGRKTSNGEVYNMYGRTAAHRTLPFGTKIRVTNMRNGRQTIVRINDRGPFIKGRDIDLSYGAAREIGMVEAGIEKVHLEILQG